MDSSRSADPSRSSDDLQRSLESIFQHPAGLRTARDLVQAVASNWFSQSAPAISTGTSGSSPEVEGILRDILAFSDTHDRTEELTMDGSDQSGDAMDIDVVEAGQYCPSATASLFANDAIPFEPPSRGLTSSETTHHLSKPHSFHAGSALQKPATDRSPESELRSIFSTKTMNGSLLPGMESPYRVESPAAQTSTSASCQPVAQLQRENTFESYSLPSRNVDISKSRFSTSALSDQTFSRPPVVPGEAVNSRARSSASFGLERASVSRFDHFTSSSSNLGRKTSHLTASTSPQSLSYAGLPPVETSAVIKDSSTIKSFLPVNKAVAHNRNDSANCQTHPRSEPAHCVKPQGQHSVQLSAQNNFFSSLQSPSPPPSFAIPQLGSSPTLNDLSSPCLTDTESETEDSSMSSRKRKADLGGAILQIKKLKKAESILKQATKKAVKKSARSKEPKVEQAKEKLPQAIWMRILEFTPPNFLTKARLINKSFKAMVDQFDSIFINCRKENFGWDMPPPPLGLTERQYSDLFGGKGCLESGCTDELSSRTHWSWAKRWCQDCWKGKIDREDRAIKRYQNQYGRLTLTKLFECIPVGVHDSFMKPHDYIDNIESRERQAPRLYKYYLIDDVEKIIKEYEDLTPAPFVENPNHTAEQKASARADHQKLMDGLEEQRNEFFATRKKANDEHMAQVQKIETAVREKRDDNRKPNNANRNARKTLFLRRAQEDIPHIPSDFVKTTKAFKAATRIFRDGGSERGWQTLKPKIEKEWKDSSKTQSAPSPLGLDGATDSEDAAMTDSHNKSAALPSVGQSNATAIHRSIPGFSGRDFYGLASSSITDLSSSMNYRANSAAHAQHLGGMYSSSSSNRNSSHLTYLGGSFLPQPFMNNSSSSAYGHAPNQFQQMMVGGSFNSHQNSHHGSHHAPRPMSIPSLLADPPRMDPMAMRFSNSQSQYMG